MTTNNLTQVMVRMEPELLDLVEEYRSQQRPIPPRAAVVKELLRRGLALGPPSQEQDGG